MTTLSTHVLDTSTGRPAAGLELSLESETDQGWSEIAMGRTDEDGRVGDLGEGLDTGTYRVRFSTGSYGNEFYPEVAITFRLDGSEEHYHVPLLLSPFGYTTYRGS